jgi:hypothetical protein
MAGQIYDWHNSQTKQRDLFFIKVDDAGIVTGMDEQVHLADEVSVYPNPGTSQINISTQETIFRFSMYDFYGRRVLEKGLHPFPFRQPKQPAPILRGNEAWLVRAFNFLSYSRGDLINLEL